MDSIERALSENNKPDAAGDYEVQGYQQFITQKRQTQKSLLRRTNIHFQPNKHLFLLSTCRG
jgi:hypothetical protein